LTTISASHPELRCVAVSHSSQADTDRWVIEVGGEWEVEVIVDEARKLYAAWGLGLASTWHVLNPWSLYSTLQLGQKEGIWNRTTESGTKWQTSGAFAIDNNGVVRWLQVPRTSSEVPSLNTALAALK
jgi:hypothetical protein